MGVALVTGLAVAAADFATISGASPRWVDGARLLLGATLLVVGAARWFGRKQADSSPAWLASVQTATPQRALALGVTLSVVNPKMLLLAVAGSVAIESAASGQLQKAMGVLVFTAVASMGVALPWLAFLAAPERTLPMLARLRTWLERYSGTLMAVVLVVLGVVLIATGLGSR